MKKFLSAAAVALLAMPALAASINEVRIDQPSTDNDEYFELAGTAGESLNALTYVVIGDGTGASGVVEAVVSLSGQSIPADGYFLAAESTFTLAPAQVDLNLGGTGLNFENSDNVSHFLVSGWTGASGQDLDTNDDGTLDITPWASVVDSIAAIIDSTPPDQSEWFYGPTVGPDGTFAPGHIYRFPNGNGGWNIGQFDPIGGADTPGVANLPEPASLALLALGALALRRR